MEKTTHFVPEPSVKEVMQALLLDLNQLPVEEPNDDMAVAPPHPPNDDMAVAPPLPPTDDVAPPLPLVIDLSFNQEDMEVLKRKYKVLDGDYYKRLGFEGECATMMHIRDKRVRIDENSYHGLGRSWVKEFPKKDENEDKEDKRSAKELLQDFLRRAKARSRAIRRMMSFPEPGNEDKTDGRSTKELLQEFIMKAKDRANKIKMKGKKKVRFALAPRDGIEKKKFVTKKRNSNSLIIIDQERDA